MTTRFPRTKQIETLTVGLRMADNDGNFYRVDYVNSRIVVISREDGGPMGAGCSVNHVFAKLRYKEVC